MVTASFQELHLKRLQLNELVPGTCTLSYCLQVLEYVSSIYCLELYDCQRRPTTFSDSPPSYMDGSPETGHVWPAEDSLVFMLGDILWDLTQYLECKVG